MVKKAVIYIRVSTMEQAKHGFSIEEQKQRLTSYCQAMGWQVVAVYVDGGHSGSTLDRPGIQQLITNIKQFDIVAVYKLDRLSRSQKDVLHIIEDVFIKNGVDIISLQESLDTSSPFGRAAIGILAAFAQLERETFKERSLLGRTGRARKGKWVGTSRPPIGYDYDVEKQQLIVNPYEADQVRLVFTMYLNGTGLQRISHTMHESGYTHKYGNWSSWGQVTTMLKNPVYIGRVTFDGQTFEGQHEAIITEDVFNETQKQLERRSTGELYKRKSPFSHLLYCGNCGSRMFYLHKKGQKQKYWCYTRYRVKFLGKECKMRIIPAEELEGHILSHISELYTNKSLLPKLLNKPTSKADASLKRRVADIDKQIGKLLELYQLEDMPVEELNSRIKKLHEEKNGITAMLGTKKKEKPQTQHLKEVFKSVVNNWDNLSLEQQTILLNEIIERVTVHDDTIDITWTFERSADE